jgi:hypothetical protein
MTVQRHDGALLRSCGSRVEATKKTMDLFSIVFPSYLYPAEAKSADAVLPNAAAGASAPMLQFESSASAGLSNFLSEVRRFSRIPVLFPHKIQKKCRFHMHTEGNTAFPGTAKVMLWTDTHRFWCRS